LLDEEVTTEEENLAYCEVPIDALAVIHSGRSQCDLQ